MFGKLPFSRRSPSVTRRKPFLPTFEQLEDRCVPNSTPVITNPGSQHSAEGVTFALQITASADPGGSALSYSVGALGLPSGVSIGASSGLISGFVDYSAVTTSAGATLTLFPMVSVTQGLFTAAQGFTFFITDTPLLQGATFTVSEGEAITESAGTSAGASAGLTYSLSSGGLGGLGGPPPGVSINASTGVMTGPVAFSAVTFGSSASFSATVTASKGGATEQVATFDWVVNATTLLQGATWSVSEGQAVSNDPRTSAGQSLSGLTYSVSSGSLPPGLTQTSGGPITGTVDYSAVVFGTSATYTATVQAASGTTVDASAIITLVVANTPLLQAAPSWAVSEGQTVTLDPRTSAGQSASGLTYSTISGTLPAGLSVNASTGLITGVPSYSDLSAGTSNYFVTIKAAKTGLTETAAVDIDLVNTPLVQVSTWTVTEGQHVTNDPRTSAGQSASGLTYSLSSGLLSVPPGLALASNGEITGTVDYTAVTVGLSETYGLALVTASSTGFSETAGLTWIVVAGNPLVQFSATSYSVSENAGSATVAVTIPAPSPNTLTVHYSSADGVSPTAAVSGLDYTGVSGNLTFSPGATTETFTIPVLDNTIDNGARIFNLSLSNPVNAVLGVSQAVVSIIDDDLPPVAVNDGSAGSPLTTNENSPLTVTVLSNDSDPNSDPLTVVDVAQGAHGTATINSANTVTYTPALNYRGDDSFTYTITDGHQGYSTATVYVHMNAVNHGPTAVNDEAKAPLNTAATIAVLANDFDVDGDTISLDSVGTPSHGTASISGSNIVYTPTTGYIGQDSFTYTIEDPYLATSTATVTLTVGGAQWATSVIDASSFYDDGSSDWQPIQALGAPNTSGYGDFVTAWSPDPEDAVYGSAAWLEVGFATPDYATGVLVRETNGNGFVTEIDLEDTGDVWHTISTSTDTSSRGGAADYRITFAQTGYLVKGVKIDVAEAADDDSIPVDADDDIDNWAEIDAICLLDATVSSSVSAAPSAANATATLDENGSTDIPTLTSVTNTSGNPLIVSVSTPPADGTAVVDPSNGDITYTPNPDFSGTDTIGYTTTDIYGQTSTATLTVTVGAVNHAPTTSDVDVTAVASTALNVDVLAAAADEDGDTLTVSVGTGPAHGTTTVNMDQSITYTPTSGYIGLDQFTYTVDDGQGGTATANVNVTVDQTGQWATSVIGFSSQFDTSDNSAAQAAGAPDTFAYGDSTTAWAPSSENGTSETLTLGYTAAQATGVLVRESDGNGFITEIDLQDTGNSWHTIWTGTDPATAGKPTDFVLTFAQTSYQVQAVRVDVDTDHDADNYEEIDAVRLLTGGSPTGTSVNTNALNQPPTAADDFTTAEESTAITVPVLANDSDSDGDTLSVTSVGTPGHGTASIASGSLAVIYTPTTGYTGADTVTYTISDGNGGTSTATIHITVYATGEWANSVIAASSQHAGTPGVGYALQALGTPNVFTFGDSGSAWSAQYENDGTQTLTVGFATPDYAAGVLVRENDGNGFVTKIELLDTSNAYHTVWTGTDGSSTTDVDDFSASFTLTSYQVKGVRITVDTDHDTSNFEEIDAVRLFTSTATSPTNTAPTASGTSLSTVENFPVDSGPLSGLGSDADSDALILGVASGPSNGSVQIVDPGTPTDTSDDFLRYTPNADFSGTDNFSYSVTDVWGAVATATVSVTVSAVNQPPVTQDDSVVTTVNTAVTVTPLANDSDPENDTLSVTSVGSAAHGTVSLSSNIATYTPGTGYAGPDSFSYAISDGNGNTSTGTVNVVVYAAGAWASSAPVASSGQDATGGVAAAVGAPDGVAWTPDGTTAREFLTVDFATAAYATGVLVSTPSGGGSVTQVDLIESGGTVHTIWSGSDPTGTSSDFVVNFPTTSYQVASVRIFVDPTQNGGSINAVRLLTGGSPSSVTVSGRGADGTGHYLDTAYNSAGQPTTGETYTNGVLVQTVTSEYTSGVLSATNTTDADSRTTRVTLDSSGNTLTSTVAYGTGDAATTTNAYTDGNLTSVTDALSDETVYTYDSIGREDSMTDPLGNEETRGYDSDSRLAWVIDRNDQLTTYAYDDNDNLLTETMYAGATDTTTVVDTLTWTYNPDGTVATAGNNQGTYTYAYDDSGRVIHVDEPSGVSLTFAYDDSGNRILVEDSLGGVEQSSYNANNQLISRTLTQGSDVLRIDFTYTQQGQIATETRYSDAAGTDLVATTVYTYDAAGSVASIVSKDASNTTIANYAYSTDAAGDLTSQTENGTTSSFTYDDQGELTGDGTNTYAFDAEGNSTADTFNTTYKNQLASDGTWNYSYDENGNETKKVNIATGVTWTYGYDNRNEMIEAKEWTEDPVYYGTAYVDLQENFKYDVYANRTEQDYYSSGPITSSAVVTKFVVDGWNPAKGTPVGNENFDVWADLTGSGTLQTRYLRGDAVDQLLARIDNSGSSLSPYWELTDHLGSIRDVIDNSTGAVKDALSYDSFGNIDTGTETDSAFRGSYAWTGREFDVETQLQYNRARYYDPSSGRWISQDPLGFDAGDSNLYRYVKNAPIDSVDPSGEIEADSRITTAGTSLSAEASAVLLKSLGFNAKQKVSIHTMLAFDVSNTGSGKEKKTVIAVRYYGFLVADGNLSAFAKLEPTNIKTLDVLITKLPQTLRDLNLMGKVSLIEGQVYKDTLTLAGDAKSITLDMVKAITGYNNSLRDYNTIIVPKLQKGTELNAQELSAYDKFTALHYMISTLRP